MIQVWHIRMPIWRSEVDLSHGSTVHIQGFLTEGANKKRYALKAEEPDPAIRFSLKMRGTDTHGYTFSLFLHSTGPTMVKYINTMVDRTSGLSMADIAKSPRRFIPKDRSNKGTKVTYT